MIFDGDLLAERARLTPDKLALVAIETGQRLTYPELNARAEHAAAAVVAAGVEPGGRYGILLHNSIDFLALFFAAAKCGAIVVPLSTRATKHELRQIVDDCGMSVLFTNGDFDVAGVGCRVSFAGVGCRVSGVADDQHNAPTPDSRQTTSDTTTDNRQPTTHTIPDLRITTPAPTPDSRPPTPEHTY